MIYISEFLLYCCFGILVGNQLLTLIPENKRPTINVPNWLVNISIVGIAVLSFFPLLTIAIMFSEGFDAGFWVIFRGVLFDFNVGHAWLITLFLAAVLLIVRSIRRMTNEPKMEYVSAAFTFALILAFAWASHCTASYQLKGFIPHAIHFLSVSVWTGTLLVVAWFSKNSNHWLSFLKWFSPVALICMVATISAGFFLMTLLVPEYVNSWIVSYGQALLFKHLLIIPLLTFAFINGVMVKRKLRENPNFNPISWVRAESIMALFVFWAMAVMGQQSPTENLAAVIQFEKPSALFQSFYDGTINPSTTIQFVAGGNSILLGFVSVLLLLSMLFLFRKKARSTLAIGLGILFVCSAYTSIMLGVQ
ncbi:CopD family protein [Paenibacillus alginolyticus]|uniref:copper resistance D family protein n=1 Tax=Paenibacillus alginolyticus TaxID=59839 RepID=UPI0003FF0C37|nr:CopD family protein [Paenibacillus alginolyticus]MCY9667395.1 CopD family protein [Paenibacillus alginolyticus]